MIRIYSQIAKLTGRTAWTLAACVALGSAVLALSGNALAQDKVLTVGNPFGPISMDPALSGNGRAGTWMLPAYEPLVRTNADGTFSPGLATSWALADDGMSLTFDLRQDAKFSDGEVVDAAAVKKSIEYWVSRNGPFSGNLASLKSVDVTGPYQVKVSLTEPNPNLVTEFDSNWLVGDIISPKAVDNPDSLLTGTYGAGPYVLDTEATITGKSYVYIPNEHYYDQSKIYWDKIVIGVFYDQNAAIQAMRAGQLKLLISDPLTGHANANSLGDGIRLVHSPLQWAGIVFIDRRGEVNEVLGDVRVRQALNMGIDRNLVAKALFGDLGKGTAQIQIEGYQGYDPSLEDIYPFDPEKAKALLAEAGYPDGVTIKVGYVNNTMNDTLYQAYAGQLSQIGVTLVAEPYQGFGPMIAATRAKSIESLVFNTNSGVPNIAKYQTLVPGGSLNRYKSEDPELTKLMDEASRLPIAEADEAWKKVYRWIVENAWFLPVAAIDVAYFATSDIDVPEVGQSVNMELVWVKPAD
jgi:peptide/nickel transport system substrate-binding protein